MPDPRRTVEHHIRNYSGIASSLIEQVLKDEAGCTALLSHPEAEVKYAALQCCHAIWKRSLSKDVVEKVVVPVLAGESHNGLLSLCLTIVGETFDGTGRQDLIAAMLRIANDTSKSNFIRNLGYKNARLVTFGKSRLLELADDGSSYETEVIGQERLINFDANYMRAFSPEVAQATEIDAQPLTANLRLLGICVLLCIAIKIALSWIGYLDPSETLTKKLLGLVEAVFSGLLAGVGVMVLVAAIVRKRIDLLTPGHWIAVSLLVSLLSDMLAFPWQTNFELFSDWAPDWGRTTQGFIKNLAQETLICTFFVAVALLNRESKIWKAFAWLSASTNLVEVLVSLLVLSLNGVRNESLILPLIGVRILLSLCNITLLILLLTGFATDLREGVKRDRLHWLCIGVVVVEIAIGMMNFLTRIVFMLF